MENKSEKELNVFIQNESISKDDNHIYLPDWKKDRKNIFLLIFLYFLQGIPLGLSASIPNLLADRKVSLSDQGVFSFVFWPFSIKLLWAPIVDSVYINKFGRRKSWLIPVQLLIAFLMFSAANISQKLLNTGQTKSEMISLAAIFIVFNTLAATQDIAVDGWAISMLRKENVGYQSICNGIGNAIGMFYGYFIFINFESKKFSNELIRSLFGLEKQDYGIITLQGFMFSIGVFFFVSTILLMIFKKEVDSDEMKLSMCSTYKTIKSILWIPSMRRLVFLLLTIKIGFAMDSLMILKLIDLGVSKEKLVFLFILLTPIFFIWPIFISKYSSGPNSFILYSKIYPLKLMDVLISFCFVMTTPYFKNSITNDYDYKFYLACFFVWLYGTIVASSIFVSQMSFFARISDERIGGTYMTFLNTIANLGGTLTSTGALFLTNALTIKNCEFKINITNSSNIPAMNLNKCSSTVEIMECTKSGGECNTKFDAYIYLSIVFLVIGLIWIICFRRLMIKLNNMPKEAWKLK